MKVINLTQGIKETEQYKAFKFPGGEVHFKMEYPTAKKYRINTRINTSDDLLLLCELVEGLKDKDVEYIEVFLPYMPYQQADRDFSDEKENRFEPFALKTIANILNNLPVDRYVVFDAHSDVTAALLKRVKVIDNSVFISKIIENIKNPHNLTLLSPDAGAYKKIGKLAAKIDFKGDIAAANKYRSISTGNLESLELSKQNFEGADILIVDDIAMGGRTFIGLAEKLRERNVGKLYLAVSHLISEYPNPELFKAFDRVFTTNSRHKQYFPVQVESGANQVQNLTVIKVI